MEYSPIWIVCNWFPYLRCHEESFTSKDNLVEPRWYCQRYHRYLSQSPLCLRISFLGSCSLRLPPPRGGSLHCLESAYVLIQPTSSPRRFSELVQRRLGHPLHYCLESAYVLIQHTSSPWRFSELVQHRLGHPLHCLEAVYVLIRSTSSPWRFSELFQRRLGHPLHCSESAYVTKFIFDFVVC